MKNLELLYDRYPVLRNINDQNENIIGKNAYFKVLQFNEYISSSNGTCQGILFIVDGRLKIQRISENGDETSLYEIKEGELCHEALSCLLNFNPLNIIGRAVMNSTICIIPIEIVRNYLLKDLQFLKYMYEDLYEKFNIIIQKREDKNHNSLQTRLIKLLISKNSKIIYGTHRDLALEIDSTREVVSRHLKLIEKEGYIKIERGKIIVLKDLNEM
ncbi:MULTISPECIES: Crp/Fnr family transcriptional regulator [Clostridium]|uniref:CarD family transcriptional regulator n=1 Tax=Clostridium carnis TaxID=1530 RepID=A0ABY6SW80_9CLOT|nr:Crp/Fnr family transcriptional regulator [Clostridium carnis]CAI3549418.1 putative regulator, cyclic nucleotide-binding domain [Clostridium neonatale]CAI3597984.1 putative regulator, cyclic nucleotide-binding domain [Clostridium neonatale]CAI3686410.1 putative regulator, cyclic nucleotide-binding domain [Clostridium neonatale]CAI3707711.1 putative regulator, cyclic nucleotide-binding domain [Clostridium neonatale]VDG72832.1 CarD family transcriptional regulator [Clostridium carnis]